MFFCLCVHRPKPERKGRVPSAVEENVWYFGYFKFIAIKVFIVVFGNYSSMTASSPLTR